MGIRRLVQGERFVQITVQKYGGSSVAGRDRIRHVAERVAERRRSGRAVVVVVSAMGKTTDELLELARGLSTDPDRRELDVLLSSGERISTSLLALAIQELGVDAISLTGEQSGIVTSEQHFDADILAISPDRVHQEIAAGKVVVAAGFQGVSKCGETTTLGRGGSDTSAVALAAALEADCCEIFSDVEGVFTADPRIVDDAAPLGEIGYVEMIELARHGASVLHPAALEHARAHGLPIRAASTFSDAPGTLIAANEAPDGDPEVRGIACHKELYRISMTPSESLEREVLEAAGHPEVFLDGALEAGRRDLILRSEAIADAGGLSRLLRREFGSHVRPDGDLGSVSAVGHGVGESERLSGIVERTSRRVGVPSGHHFSSDHSLTLLLRSPDVPATMRTLHGALVETAPAVTGTQP